MSKNSTVKTTVEQMETRIKKLSETQERLDIFNGLNDGSLADDNRKRLLEAQDRLKKFIDDNIEYIL